MRGLVREVESIEASLARGSKGPKSELAARARQVREALTAGAVTAESTDLLVRGVVPSTLERFKIAAGARAMRYADYLSALVELHDAMRALADSDDHPAIKNVLDELGLATVTA